MGVGGRGVRQRDGVIKEMGEERYERMGVDRFSLWGVLFFMEGGLLYVFGGFTIGMVFIVGKGGDRQWGDYFIQEFFEFFGVAVVFIIGRGRGAAGVSYYVFQIGVGVVI